eukprot:gene19812-26496_t
MSSGAIEVKGKGIMQTFHIQMNKEAFDVNAIKRDYKHEIEKADDTMDHPRSPEGHLMAVAGGSAARFIPVSRLSPFISPPLPIPTTNSRLLPSTSTCLLTKRKSSTASAAALNDMLLIGFRGPVSTGN